MKSKRYIGKSIGRFDAHNKLTGKAKYIDDITPPDCWHGITIRSTIASGKIKEIIFDNDFDFSNITIIDYKDIPGPNRLKIIHNDQPYLAEKEVRHYGEPILLLAHSNKELLAEARKHIKIIYHEKEPILSIEESLQKKAIIFQPDNIFEHIIINKGDIDTAFVKADRIIFGEYRTSHQEQAYLETQGMIAEFRDGNLTIWGSMQCPYYVHNAMKSLFNLDDGHLRVIQTTTGGAFGGKEDYPSLLAGHTALLAYKCGHPVKIVYDRAEDIAVTTKRHPSLVRHRTAVTNDGVILGMDIDVLLDGGAYSTLSPVVLSRAVLHAGGTYRCDNIKIDGKVVATNTPPNGAFRGFGTPQVLFALESHIDKIASILNISPIEIRQRNLLQQNDTLPTGQNLGLDVACQQIMARALESSDYESKLQEYKRFNTQHNTKKRGIGISSFFHGGGFTGSGESLINAEVILKGNKDGKVEILVSNVEMGQGAQTVFRQIVAEVLQVSPKLIIYDNPNTGIVPNSGPTVASRTTMIVGKVLEESARKFRDYIRALDNYNNDKECSDLIKRNIKEYGRLQVASHYQKPPGLDWDKKNYKGDAYGTYAWACDIAEVEVDLLTGETKVLKLTSVVDIGQVINPQLAEGQVEGGSLQGIGYAIYENEVIKDGKILNPNLTDYIIPTFQDSPEFVVEFIPGHYAYGGCGAKGLGELPMNGAAPAVTNAIHNACGITINQIPAIPERILSLIQPRMDTKKYLQGEKIKN